MKLETTKPVGKANCPVSNSSRHALRLSHLSVMQQQRALRNLARACRMRNKEKLLNAESQEANTYDWHRNVRLKREARAYNLIRAYLKGIPYKQVEQSLKPTTITPLTCINYASGTLVLGNDGWLGLFDWLEAE